MLSINLRVVNLPRSISAVWIFLQITATGEVGGCKIRSLQLKTALYPQIFCNARYCIANPISRNITARREKLKKTFSEERGANWLFISCNYLNI